MNQFLARGAAFSQRTAYNAYLLSSVTRVLGNPSAHQLAFADGPPPAQVQAKAPSTSSLTGVFDGIMYQRTSAHVQGPRNGLYRCVGEQLFRFKTGRNNRT